MIVLLGTSGVNAVPDFDIRFLAKQRFAEICGDEPYDYDRHGHMIAVEPGDTAIPLNGLGQVIPVSGLSSFSFYR